MRHRSITLFGIGSFILLAGTFCTMHQENLQPASSVGSTITDSTIQSISEETTSENGNRSGSCDSLTTATTEGPYYVTNTPHLPNNNLNDSNLPGTPIKVSGFVYSGTSNTPVPNAKIELWQADTRGNYHPNANGNSSNFNENDLALRGYVVTNHAGYYDFSSIYPGYYEGRARHIHAKISADNFQDVFTQIMFKPNPEDGVTFSTDEIAQSLPPCHLLQMTENNGFETGSIDFRLQPN